MIAKGTEQYKAASKLANEIKNLSNTDRVHNHSYYEIAFTIYVLSWKRSRKQKDSLLK